MNWHYIKKNLKAFCFLTTLKFRKALTFKTNLIAQSIGMILNNLAVLLVWWFLLERFGSINGYTFKEILLIQGFAGILYGLFYYFVGGITRLGEYLNQDRFLDLQLYPISPLTVMTTKSGNASQMGDLIEGGVLIGIYLLTNPAAALPVIVGVILAVAGVYGVTLAVNSLLFFFPKIVNSFGDIIENVYFGGVMYPSKNFEGGLRYVFFALLLVPIVSYPIEVARKALGIEYLAITTIAVIGINILAYFVWCAGIKRVESGASGGIVD